MVGKKSKRGHRGLFDDAVDRVEAKLAEWEAESSRRLAALEKDEEERFAAHQQFLSQFEQQLDHLRQRVQWLASSCAPDVRRV